MDIYKELFGSKRAEMWHQLSALIGAKYVNAGPYDSERIDLKVDDWLVTMDAVDAADTFYTRFRAPFKNLQNLRFSISRVEVPQGLASPVAGHDITVGDPFFDNEFLVKGNNEALIVDILQDTEIRRLLELQSSVHFEIRDSEGSFGPKFPEDVDELYFIALKPINDINHLKAVFDLFAEVLHQLSKINIASGANPEFHL